MEAGSSGQWFAALYRVPSFSNLVRSVVDSSGFEFHILASSSHKVASEAFLAFRDGLAVELKQRADAQESPAPRQIHVLRLPAAVVGGDLEISSTRFDQIIEHILEPLFYAPPHGTTVGVIWIDAWALAADNPGAWAAVFRRINVKRNELVRTLHVPLILSLGEHQETSLAHNAPDLWSIRTSIVRVEVSPREFTATSADLLPPLPQPPPVQPPWNGTWSALDTALAAAQRRSSERPDITRLHAESIWLSRRSRYRWEHGELLDAEKDARQVISILRAIIARAPQQRYRTEDLVHAQEWQGILEQTLGNRIRARSTWEEAILKVRELLALDRWKDRVEVRLLHARLLLRLGLLEAGIDNRRTASLLFQGARKILDRFPATCLSNIDVTAAIGRLRGNMGDLSFSAGDLDAARVMYEEGLASIDSVADRVIGRHDILELREALKDRIQVCVDA